MLISALAVSCYSYFGQDAPDYEPMAFEIEFSYVRADEFVLNDAVALVEYADHVFIGMVNSISFAMINDVTGAAPTENCNPNHIILVTIYDVNVLAAYKGAQQETIRVMKPGGIRGYREREQLLLTIEAGNVSRYGTYHMLIYPDIPALAVGIPYLFIVQNLLADLDGYNHFVGIINSQQSFLEIADPFKSIDTFSNITVEAIISEFGETAFEVFLQNQEVFLNR